MGYTAGEHTRPSPIRESKRQLTMLPLRPLNSYFSLRPSPPLLALNHLRNIHFRPSARGSVQVQASVGGGDQSQTMTTTPLDSKERREKKGPVEPGSGVDEGIQVRAVVTIKKKMKEKIGEKLGDQWEYLVNGVGQGIQIQLISHDIDPGYLLSPVSQLQIFLLTFVKILIYVFKVVLRSPPSSTFYFLNFLPHTRECWFVQHSCKLFYLTSCRLVRRKAEAIQKGKTCLLICDPNTFLFF